MTPATRPFRLLARYTAWADERLYAALAQAPADVVTAPRPGRPAGLAGTLGHMQVVDRIWQAHLQGRAHGFTTRTLEPLPPLSALHAAQHALDQWYIGFADAQTETALAEVIDFRFVDGGAGSMARGDMLQHIVQQERVDDLIGAALQRNREEWMLRMRLMGPCPCKQSKRSIARFRSNPAGSGICGRSAALRHSPIAGLWAAHRA
ncbi:DinB family protein [Paracidovorax wautersii]|uniref:Damage-inducible protein DinB n=1 Tax=Paracidovorax wautersii TaxID=1177982 RepID=A0ABU1I7H1_9BURK|nr:DinB family protein [Paracidovorax wautersii]MDR6213157.1 putative damage-inducible protein DinB [Paracidovorax wautersii]